MFKGQGASWTFEHTIVTYQRQREEPKMKSKKFIKAEARLELTSLAPGSS
jgi:hypothetical protein